MLTGTTSMGFYNQAHGLLKIQIQILKDSLPLVEKIQFFGASNVL